MFKTIIASVLAVAASAEVMNAVEFEFMSFIAKFNKNYGTREEYQARLTRFIEVDAHVKKVNAPNSGYTHRAGHNKFSDWTTVEYEKMFTLNHHKAESKHRMKASVHKSKGAAPAQVDWRTGSCQTPVKDQGNCGSCWTFATTESNESSYCIDNGTLYTLSE